MRIWEENARFPDGATLAANERAIVAKLPQGFAIRYPDVTAQVFGPYAGQLANGGETFSLNDGGETVLDISYEDDWYPETDGSGRSLVLRSDLTPFTDFDQPESYGSSLELTGSPGSEGSGFGTHFNGWQEARFSREQRAVGEIGHPDTDSDGDSLTLWEEYALGLDPQVPDSINVSVLSAGTGASSRAGLSLQRRRNATDVATTFAASSDLISFTPIVGNADSTELTSDPDIERATYLDPDTISAKTANFYRITISQLAPE